MLSLLQDVTTPPREVFSLRLIITVLVVAIIVYPLQKALRRAVSERRKQRWAREEGSVSEHPQLPPEPDDPRNLPG